MKPTYTQPKDFKSLLEAYESCFKHGNLSDYAIRQYFDMFGKTTYLAEVDNKSAGLCIGGVSSTDRHEGWILSLAVCEDYRRLGIARSLMRETVRNLCNRHCTRILLTVTETNDSARDLFMSLGFKEVSIDTNYYADNNTKLVLEYINISNK